VFLSTSKNLENINFKDAFRRLFLFGTVLVKQNYYICIVLKKLQLMELATQIFQFILSISILVVLHELGHFLPAKWFKCRIEKFYLFFDPWFSLVKKKIGETEYGIGWLPFGGYVKIAGMVDESMDTEQLKQPAQPWEFRSKPAWQRLIIMLGGIFVNLILAWAIYTGLNLSVGEKYHDLAKFQNGIAVSEEGAKMGLENGDKILKIDGKPAERLENSLLICFLLMKLQF
jgi:regulator of sigma E protease